MAQRRIVPTILLIFLGVLLGFPVVAGTYQAMVVTSTPEFCGSCHEIRPAVEAWRSSTHANNKAGLKAVCMDCHLPPPENTFEFFAMKTYHGLKDITSHLLDGAEHYDKAAARENMYAEITNETCMRCHENVLYMPTRRGAMLAHRAVVHARPGNEKKCVDCHYDLVHTEKRMTMYAQARKTPYQAKGLRTLKIAGDSVR